MMGQFGGGYMNPYAGYSQLSQGKPGMPQTSMSGQVNSLAGMMNNPEALAQQAQGYSMGQGAPQNQISSVQNPVPGHSNSGQAGKSTKIQD